MNIINLTPHAITLAAGGVNTIYPPSGVVARVVGAPAPLTSVEITGIGAFPLSRTQKGEVFDLPPPVEGVIYITSGFVGAHSDVRGVRPDVFSPGTGPLDGAIRENNQIVAVTRLVQF